MFGWLTQRKQTHKLTNVRKSHRITPERWTRHKVEPVVTVDPETGEPVADVREIDVRGAKVTDHDAGLVYCLTIEERRGGAAITYLSVESMRPGVEVGRDTLPHSTLVRYARAVLAEERPRIHDRRVRVPGTKPPLAEFARDHARHNRQTLADLYDVSPSTVDRWIREARDTTNPDTGKPYLGKARTGRPPKTSDSPAER